MTRTLSKLNKELFTTVLAAKLKADVSIIDLKVESDKALVNYCSDIHRVTVKYSCRSSHGATTKVTKLLVKSLYDTFRQTSKEHLMYVKVLPEINQLLSECGIDNAISSDFYLAAEHGELYIFEDMNARGYAMCKRLEGFSAAEAHLVFKRLGHFHAAAMIFKAKHPDMVMKHFIYDFMDLLESNISTNITYVTRILDTWPSPYPAIASKMRQNTGNTFKRKLQAIYSGEPANLNVIVHGDLWISNILVLTKDQQPSDAVFVDYQTCYYGSAAIDLHNLFITSCTLQALESNHELIQSYYKSLRSTLGASPDFNNELIPSFEALWSEVKRTSFLSFFYLLFQLPLTMLREEYAREMNLASFADAKLMARNREDMFSHAGLLKTYKYILPQLDAEGVLD